MDAPSPRPRMSWGPAILAGLVLCASSVGVMLYQLSQDKQAPEEPPAPFDFSQVQNEPPPAAPVTAPEEPEASGLSMLKPGMKIVFSRPKASAGKRAASAQSAAEAFREAIRRAEGQAQALAMRYTRQYPSIRQYGRDWMSYPDLKKLNDDYMRDHDPVRFMRGLVRAPNFLPLTRKYAGDPAIQSFIKTAIREAPASVLGASLGYFQEDKPLQDMVANGPLRDYLSMVKPADPAAAHRPLSLPDQQRVQEMEEKFLKDDGARR